MAPVWVIESLENQDRGDAVTGVHGVTSSQSLEQRNQEPENSEGAEWTEPDQRKAPQWLGFRRRRTRRRDGRLRYGRLRQMHRRCSHGWPSFVSAVRVMNARRPGQHHPMERFGRLAPPGDETPATELTLY